MESKKAQGISMNIIIIAAIAIIVLVVIVAIFGGKARQFGKGTEGVSEGFDTKKICKIPGVYGRECKTPQLCEDEGGSVVPGSEFEDCPQSYCCQK